MFKFLEKLVAKIVPDSHTRGFDYAAGVLLRKELTPMDMENYYDGAFSSGDKFDLGMKKATDLLCELNVVPDNRIYAPQP